MTQNIRILGAQEVLSPLQASHILILSDQGCDTECIPCHFREVWNIELSSGNIEAFLDRQFELTTDLVTSGEHYVDDVMVPSGIYWEIVSLYREEVLFIQRHLFCRWGILFHIETLFTIIERFEYDLPRNEDDFSIYPLHFQRPRAGGYHLHSLPTSPVPEDPALSANANAPTRHPPPPYSPQPNFNGISFRHPREVTPAHGTHLAPFYNPIDAPAPPVYVEPDLGNRQATSVNNLGDLFNRRTPHNSIDDDSTDSDLGALRSRATTPRIATFLASAPSSPPAIPARNPARLYRPLSSRERGSESSSNSAQIIEPTSVALAGITEGSPPSYEPTQSLREYLNSLLRPNGRDRYPRNLGRMEGQPARYAPGTRPELGDVVELFAPIYFIARDEAPTLIDETAAVSEGWFDGYDDDAIELASEVEPVFALNQNNESAELIAEVDSYLEWMQERQQLTALSLSSSASSLHSIHSTADGLDSYSNDIIAELRFSSDPITQEVLHRYSAKQTWSPSDVSQILREIQAARRRQDQLTQLQQTHEFGDDDSLPPSTSRLNSSAPSGHEPATLQNRFNDALARLRRATDVVSALEGNIDVLPSLSSPTSEHLQRRHSRNPESEHEILAFIGAVDSALGEADLGFDHNNHFDDED